MVVNQLKFQKIKRREKVFKKNCHFFGLVSARNSKLNMIDNFKYVSARSEQFLNYPQLKNVN